MDHEHYLQLQAEVLNGVTKAEKASALALLSIAYSLQTLAERFESVITDDGCVSVMAFPPLEHLLRNMVGVSPAVRKLP
jgi:hypothetical protein